MRFETEVADINKDLRINEQILRGPRETRVRDVRVIDENGQALGIMNVRDALALAQEKGLDLIEVAPMAQPPVCRIGDYGRIKYEQTKREREQQRKQRQQGEVKDVRIDPRSGMISDHDLQIKVKNIARFLQEGNKVKVTFRFIGRGITRPELGKQTMERIVQQLADCAQVERPPVLEGKQLIMVLSPKTGA
ncbi:bacterial translation initiation factor 3 (bIF-3) [Chthonomonas calidirosea]|uniref:Translation initiation factor IF-3 n=1 Tax=Chthonomonas calidirosea (strain DSM 23976 / ICMP 18418 / T49) TaxID=1303518 RepID=S0ETD9_CHTCT|nr:translation initiation factor IF-3 [Chthonomonas calidirosea]CCW34716.1 bacterial translation initiation factor 3 (bIF-3) [Chthonomonas calidirosea T49]CEK12906.1 bacterial translation initiation factor 3 (bIF-3) [Chthonomonas calidirosea]CEK12907.1 bacterial translation initiation factor 3 (bIF-3) [Chthonomonas calidirosea]CEK13997.1 bacterial translation initiation factor 3 (bIF-3) [Chthonomonas calidirosea]